ncbi:prepilin-type N-terminal cleavage/methylation domain-containing protein [uncultured Microbacterium sp.]|uniref:prepilin-type N-terminal cleavage/methylation domain-containing protein n=1 Tax=uncultured Microbacterium sp. TaxID=191216 RepID=UPI0035CA25E2
MTRRAPRNTFCFVFDSKRAAARGYRGGFTIVEVLIVVVLIAILATIATLGSMHFLAEGRDAQRTAAATTLAEALEKYYDQNGEYPSCPTMTADASSVSTTLRVDESALKLPGAASSNSISCADLTATSDVDVLAYVGDGSTQCKTGLACVSWVLKYKAEGSNEIESITSRRTGTVSVAPDAAASVVIASVSDATAMGAASSVNCGTADALYRLRSKVNNGSWTESLWSTARTMTVPAHEGSQYSFQADTQCAFKDGTKGAVATSNTAVAVRPITAPEAPILTATAIGDGTVDSVTWSWAATLCPSGTSAEYATAYYRDDATGWRAWAAPTTSLSYTYATNYQGFEYRVKAKTRCKNTYATSNYSADSNEPAFARVVDTPGTVSGFHVEKETFPAPSGGGTYEASRVWWDVTPTCGVGTSRRLQVFGWSNYTSPAMPASNFGGYAGGGGTAAYPIDSNTPSSNLGGGQHEYRWRTDGYDKMQPRFRTAADADSLSDTYQWKTWAITSSSRVSVGGSIVYLDGNSTYLRAVRAYARYACINTTTGEQAIGAPALSSWQQWY